jgi:hypothetical protein
MNKRWILYLAALAAFAGNLGAQQYQRRATITGGGDRDRGKCTIEVVVDGVAEIDIRGDQAVLRNLAGQPAQWRRFQCNMPMPPNPPNFRFTGIDGRGRQELVRHPRNSGPAVVRIEDPQGGSEGYTFDLTWDGGFSSQVIPQAPMPQRRDYRRFTAEQAVSTCQDAVRRRALNDYRARGVEFRETRMDDNPGRNDWVVGSIDVLRRQGEPDQRLRFSCSVNFDTGEVRSVDLQPVADRMTQRSIDTCQRAVAARVRRFDNDRIEFPSIRIDDNPGRNNWVVGTVRADHGRGLESFNFSCAVDPRDGDVRSVDLNRR